MFKGNTDEKAAKAAVKQQAAAVQAEERARAQWWASPVGQATAAYQNGDAFF